MLRVPLHLLPTKRNTHYDFYDICSQASSGSTRVPGAPVLTAKARPPTASMAAMTADWFCASVRAMMMPPPPRRTL